MLIFSPNYLIFFLFISNGFAPVFKQLQALELQPPRMRWIMEQEFHRNSIMRSYQEIPSNQRTVLTELKLILKTL